MAAPASNPPRIDTHFHVFAAGVAQPGARYVPDYTASHAAWWTRASAAGIGGGVLVQPSFLGTDNSRLVAELRAHPAQLRGVAVLPHDVAPDTVRALHAEGVRGIRLNLAGLPHDLGPWRRAAATWDQLLALGWHVELHTDTGALPGVLDQLPAALPVVVDHMARPASAAATDPTLQALARRAGGAGLHVKLSGAYRLQGLDAREVAQAVLAVVGPGRLLWGSDWPCTNHEACAHYPTLLAALVHWVGPVVAGTVLADNPRALYWAA